MEEESNLPPGVRDFVVIYPPTNSSEFAIIKAFTKMQFNGAKMEDILQGAQAYANHVKLKGISPAYIKLAHKWLYDRDWTIKYEEVKPPRLPAPKNISFPWEERDRDVRNMAKHYISGFMKEPLGVKARDEGWDLYLWRYTSAMAFLQAQVVHKCVSFIYDSIIFPEHPFDGHAELIKELTQPRNEIVVKVPPEKITEFMRKAKKPEVAEEVMPELPPIEAYADFPDDDAVQY